MQQALVFLFIFSLTSSDASVGTRTEMCTTVWLSVPVANLHSVVVGGMRKAVRHDEYEGRFEIDGGKGRQLTFQSLDIVKKLSEI